MRILYLHGTHVPPPRDPRNDRFAWLSPALEGDILQEVWIRSAEDAELRMGPNPLPVFSSKGFQYHFLLSIGKGRRRSKLSLAWFFVSEGLRIHRERGFDCVITYSHTLTAVCGVILKVLTRARLIVEIVGMPSTAYLYQLPKPGFRLRIGKLYSEICLHACLWSCDRVHLLAPSLISTYKRLRNVPASVFFEAVPISPIPRHTSAGEPYVLLVGAPSYRKGVDLLIAAFRRLAPDFPEVKLKVLGYYPDRAQLEILAGGLPQIEILKPRLNSEVVEIISKATVFALPSRSEGVPRVILEAMAAGVPVVASDVDGIPTLVRDGVNGFLVPTGDIGALEARLRQLLSDPALRSRMGARGYELAHTEFNEKAYVEQFTRMVEETVKGSAPDRAKPQSRGI